MHLVKAHDCPQDAVSCPSQERSIVWGRARLVLRGGTVQSRRTVTVGAVAATIRVHKCSEIVYGLVYHALHARQKRNPITRPPHGEAMVGRRTSAAQSLPQRVGGSPVGPVVAGERNWAVGDAVLPIRNLRRFIIHVTAPHLAREALVRILGVERHERPWQSKPPVVIKPGVQFASMHGETTSG
jgi:hypothetical protein